MKNKFFSLKGLLVAAAGVFLLGTTGCEQKVKPTLPMLTINYDGVAHNGDVTPAEVSADGDKIPLSITSTRDWRVTIPTDAAGWVVSNVMNGNSGTKSVEIEIKKNEGTTSRSANVVFSVAELSRTVRISQLGQGELPSVGMGEGRIPIKDLNRLFVDKTVIPANTYIEGTIISDVAGANLDTRGFCIWDAQTPGSAIQIYQLQGLPEGTSQSHSFAVNTTVKVQLDGGEMSIYNGLHEVTKINVSAVTPASVTAITAPVVVANHAALAPNYQNMLVSMPNVTATANVGTSWGAGSADKTTAFKDADNAAFNVFVRRYSYQGFQDNAIPATSGSIVGIVGYHTTYGTQIQPRNMDDVAGLGSGAFAYTFVVSSASKAAAAGGASTANITTGADVAWTATLKSGTGGTVGTPSGTGSGPVTVNFDANTGAERSVTVTIATTASNVTGTKTYDVVFTQSEAGAAAEKIATFDIPNMGLTTQAEWGTQTVNGITITGAGGGNTNTPKFYNGTSTTVTALRTYKDNTLTFTGGTITKIEWEDGTRKDGVTANTGAVAGTVWTGSSTSVVLTTASTTVTNPQQHYVKITVTYN